MADSEKDAREIAGKFAGVVHKIDQGLKPMAGKGHVPEENLERYRSIAGVAHLISRLGNMVSNMGEHGDANRLWEMGGKYKRMANELRADLPQETREEEE